MAVYKKYYGETHLYVATIYQDIGLGNNIIGNYDTAINYLEKALQIYLSILGGKHETIANCYKYFGYVYLIQKKNADALTYFQKALQIYLELFGANNPNTIEIQQHIDTIKQQLNSHE